MIILAKCLSLILVLTIYAYLGWQGIVGAGIAMILWHIAYKCEHGHWWQTY